MATNNGIFYGQKEGLKLSTNNINRVLVSTAGTTTVSGTNNNSIVLNVKGTQGDLVTVTDNINGSLFSVLNSLSGSIFTVNSNNSVVGGSPSANTFVISGTSVGIGNILAPTNKLHVSAATDPVRFVGIQDAADNKVLTVDDTGVVHKIFMSAITGTTSTGTTSGSTSATTIYNGNGTLLTNRIVQLSSNTLTLSSATNNNSFIFNGTGLGINVDPSYALDIAPKIEFEPIRVSAFNQIDNTALENYRFVVWDTSSKVIRVTNISALTEITLTQLISDNFPVTALTITVATGEIGQLDVSWYGITSAGDNFVTGRGITRYFKNSSNTLTTSYGTVFPVEYNGLFNGTEVDVTPVGGNVVIEITSLIGYDVYWRLDIRRRGIGRLGTLY